MRCAFISSAGKALHHNTSNISTYCDANICNICNPGIFNLFKKKKRNVGIPLARLLNEYFENVRCRVVNYLALAAVKVRSRSEMFKKLILLEKNTNLGLPL